MPVRIGMPQYTGGLAEVVRSTRYATGVGLLIAGANEHRQRDAARMHINSFQQVVERMKNWFTGNF